MITGAIMKELMLQELQILSSLTHPNIMRIYELLEDEVCYYVVSELIFGGDLAHAFTKKGKNFGQEYLSGIMKQVILALCHMHAQGMAHRDLKPENILMIDEDNIKLADFGFAVNLSGRKENKKLGSPLFMAPEVLRGDNYTTKVDIWSIGVIVHLLLTGRPTATGTSKEEFMDNIRDKEPKILGFIEEPALSFITQCLTRDVSKRPTAQQLLDTPFLQQW